MTLRMRIGATLAVLAAVLAVGEWFGARRRAVLHRQVPERQLATLAPGQVRVHVKGEDGLPVPMGWMRPVQWYRDGANQGGGGGWTNFGEGRAVVHFPERDGKNRRIEVWGATDNAGRRLPFGAVLVGPLDAGVTEMDVVLPGERTLPGSIREDGAPVRYARVRARIAYPEEFAFLADLSDERSWQGEAQTGYEGTFLLKGLGAGPQQIRIEGPDGLAIADLRREGGVPLDLDLRAGKAPLVTVSVVAGAGKPVSAARVQVRGVRRGASDPSFHSGESSVAIGRTGGDGRIRIWGLDPGTEYQLVVDRPGAGTSTGPFLDTRWTPKDLTVSMWSARSMKVRVLDGGGLPHVGAEVSVSFDDGTGRSRTGQTGSDGSCVLGGLPPTEVTVGVFDTCSFHAPETRVSKKAGPTDGDLLFTMERGPAVTLKVTGGSARGAVTAVLAGDGEAASSPVQIVRGGSAAWHDLDPAGTYTAFLSDPLADRAAAVPGLRPGAAPASVNLVPAKAIRVVVQWPEGATGRMVTADRGAVTLGYGSAQEDGTWLVKCLPDGEYVVHAACMVPGRRPPPGAFATAVAGGEVSIQVR